MSEQDIWLDPDRACRGGRDLAYAVKGVPAQRETLGAEIAAASADRPWGKDDIGSAFEKNYREFEQSLLKAWSSVGRYVEDLGTSVVTSVVNTVETDARNGQRIRQTYT